MAKPVHIANTSATGGGSPLTFTHTVSAGSDRCLIVGAAAYAPGSVPTVTYNGTSMTLINSINNDGTETCLFYLVNPDTGANDVVVTAAGSDDITAGADSYTGVDQSTPIGTPVAGSATGYASVTATTDSLIVDVFSFYNEGGGAGATADHTGLWAQATNQFIDQVFGQVADGTGSAVSMGWTPPATLIFNSAQVAVALIGASASSTVGLDNQILYAINELVGADSQLLNAIDGIVGLDSQLLYAIIEASSTVGLDLQILYQVDSVVASNVQLLNSILGEVGLEAQLLYSIDELVGADNELLYAITAVGVVGTDLQIDYSILDIVGNDVQLLYAMGGEVGLSLTVDYAIEGGVGAELGINYEILPPPAEELLWGNITGYEGEGDRTNAALFCRDFTNAAWVKSTVTATLDAAGADGEPNQAATLAATATDGTVIQTITKASSVQNFSVFLKRSVGTGDVFITLDNGATWTDVTDLLSEDYYVQVQANQTLANPSFGVRLNVSGDEVLADFAGLVTGVSAFSPTVTLGAPAANLYDGGMGADSSISTAVAAEGSLSLFVTRRFAEAPGAIQNVLAFISGDPTVGAFFDDAIAGRVSANDGTNETGVTASAIIGQTQEFKLVWGEGFMQASLDYVLSTEVAYAEITPSGLLKFLELIDRGAGLKDMNIYNEKLTATWLSEVSVYVVTLGGVPVTLNGALIFNS